MAIERLNASKRIDIVLHKNRPAAVTITPGTDLTGNFTGRTAVLNVSHHSSPDTVVLSLTQITGLTPGNGVIDVALTALQTDLLAVDTVYDYFLGFTDAGAEPVAFGKIVVTRAIGF